MRSKGTLLCAPHYGPRGWGGWVPWSARCWRHRWVVAQPSRQMSSESMTAAVLGSGKAVKGWPMSLTKLAVAQPRKIPQMDFTEGIKPTVHRICSAEVCHVVVAQPSLLSVARGVSNTPSGLVTLLLEILSQFPVLSRMKFKRIY